MRMTFVAAFLALVALHEPLSAQGRQARPAAAASGPAIPGCQCSEGTEIRYSDSASMGKVFAATCVCGPQTCAVSWNRAIDMQCIKTDVAQQPNHCADFTKLPVGELGVSARVGSFDIRQIAGPPGTPPRPLRIGHDTIVGTNPPLETPNSLFLADPGVEFVYPVLYRTAEIDLTYYIRAGAWITIHTGRNDTVRFHYPFVGPEGRPQRITVTHADGIKKMIMAPAEVHVFQVCALDQAR
ncbi:MAG: hypothetical protein JNK84_06695 [Phreatobacter sp.]|uniref:hypothetical protein n=1 Tax=Phreatobacter sp. TaxID=1966341 RepID=UPI001A3A21C6|nr:hypothetical protein [Phreatobacter sp.]MBL8568758.1 hypothetical protein [Phreatobacter sp.]